VICEPVVAAAFGRRIMFVYRRSGRILEFVGPRPTGSQRVEELRARQLAMTGRGAHSPT
jgi:hypothetical protein